jgi:hypothetical protein
MDIGNPLGHAPLRVPGDFPEVSIRISDVAQVSTPEEVIGPIGDSAASACLISIERPRPVFPTSERAMAAEHSGTVRPNGRFLKLSRRQAGAFQSRDAGRQRASRRRAADPICR